jgi:hypothetical protein
MDLSNRGTSTAFARLASKARSSELKKVLLQTSAWSVPTLTCAVSGCLVDRQVWKTSFWIHGARSRFRANSGRLKGNLNLSISCMGLAWADTPAINTEYMTGFRCELMSGQVPNFPAGYVGYYARLLLVSLFV